MDNNMSKIIEGKMDFRSKLVMKLEVRDQRAAWCSLVATYILIGQPAALPSRTGSKCIPQLAVAAVSTGSGDA